MWSRDSLTAISWKCRILTGSTRLNTPPTPRRASSSVICPSDSSCTCCSFSSTVIWASSRSTRPSTPRSASCRTGCNAASSRDCVAAITPPATIRLIATTVATSAVVRLRGLMTTLLVTPAPTAALVPEIPNAQTRPGQPAVGGVGQGAVPGGHGRQPHGVVSGPVRQLVLQLLEGGGGGGVNVLGGRGGVLGQPGPVG